MDKKIVNSSLHKAGRDFSAGKFLLWLFLLLALLEVFTRVFILKLPPRHLVPGLGVVPLDHSVTVWGVEGYGVTHYFEQGEISTPYRSGTSVVVLGDSLTEGWQVGDGANYVSVAERTLKARGVDFDLHNLGTSGRNMADYVYMAPFVMQTYSPAVVVVQVTETDFTESLDSSWQNYFVFEDEALRFVHNENYAVPALGLQNVIRGSGIGSLAINKLIPLLRDQWLLRREKWLAWTEPGRSRAVSSPGDSNAARLEMQIEKQAEAVQRAYPGAKVVFFVVPTVPAMEEGSLVSVSDRDTRLCRALNRVVDLPVLYPADAFVSLYTAHETFPRGFFNSQPNSGHLNAEGNAAAGAALADYLEEMAR